MGFSETQKMINARRKSQRLPIKEIPPDLINYEDQVQKYQAQHDQAVQQGKTRQEIVEIDKLLNPAIRRLKHEIEKYQGRI